MNPRFGSRAAWSGSTTIPRRNPRRFRSRRDKVVSLTFNIAMEVVRDIASARSSVARARNSGRRIGLVPTMGALHAGHTSLVEASRSRSEFVAVTIFVNPTQFGPNEDYQSYPRDEQSDLRKCAAAGVELVLVPPASEIYAPDAVTSIHVARLIDTLCGPFRPGHFEGVATIVAKLFNIVRPDAAYFGQKDAQQLAIIRRITRDLNFPVEIVGCPIVREPDGLAMSSRNVYLTPQERLQARSLSESLRAAADAAAAGTRDAAFLVALMTKIVESAGPSRIEYISVVDPDSLQPVMRIEKTSLVALAVRIGKARLIDNAIVGG